MAPLLKKVRLLAAKAESTAGTAESLTATEAALNVYDATIQSGMALMQREGQAAMNRLAAIAGQYVGTCTFRTDLWWDGTATEPAWASVLFPACGWVDSGSGVYSPKSSPPGVDGVTTVTLATYQSGDGNALKKQLHGAVGAWQLTCPTGQMAYIDWTFTGVWDTPVDATQLAPTYPTDKPARYAGATTSWNTRALCVSQATIQSGNVVVPKECADNAAGIDYFLVSDRQPIFNLDPEGKLVANGPLYTELFASTEGVMNITLPGAAGGTIEFKADKGQLQNVQEGDRNSIQTEAITVQANKDGATNDEELTITFVAAV